MSVASVVHPPVFRVRRSPIHGTGVFAKRALGKGERIMEYVGERVSHAEADRRYQHKAPDDNHTFLFTVDSRTVIDAGNQGNDARWVNHSCQPNCETIIEEKRVFVETIRAIEAGEELTYDYMIGREASDPPDIDDIFACRCGSPKCRGTMLLPPKKTRPRVGRAARGAAAANGRGAAATPLKAHSERADRRAGGSAATRGRATGRTATQRKETHRKETRGKGGIQGTTTKAPAKQRPGGRRVVAQRGRGARTR